MLLRRWYGRGSRSCSGERASAVTGRGAPLGFWSLLALGINGIVGVGIFFAPHEVAARVPGTAGTLVYALTAAALLPIAWTYATLGARFDMDGGPYVWARAAFGPRVAFGVGWVAYVSAIFSTSTVLAGLMKYAAPAVGLGGPVGSRAFIVVVSLCMGAIVAAGLRPSAATWSALTVTKLLPLCALALLGLLAASGAAAAATPAAPGEWTRAMLVVVFALQGFEIVPVLAGSARRSARAVPAATLGSLVVAALLYVALHRACVGAVPRLGTLDTPPLVDAGRALGGPGLATLIAYGTDVSALGIGFGMIAMTPRYLTALGGGDALGSWAGALDARGVPKRSLALTLAVVGSLVLSGRLEELFALSSLAVLLQYAVSAAALLRLGLARRHGLGPGDALPALLALPVIAFVARAAHASELLVVGGMLVLGGVLRVLRSKSATQGAL